MKKSSNITIIDYKCGNLFSLIRVLEKLNCKITISNKFNDIIKADKILLPGVGSFKIGYENLQKDNLNKAIVDFKKKGNFLLGICLGMQLLLTESHEFGLHKGLDLIPGKVKKLIGDENVKIPHVGWNSTNISTNKSFGLMDNIKNFSYFYFTHSFAGKTDDIKDTLATTHHGRNNFSSIIIKENAVGFQFHPEKSGLVGEKLINNFLSL